MRIPLLMLTTSLATLLLYGCNGGAGPVDSKQFLNSLEGPKVTGVTDAMLQTATQAEAQGNFTLAAQAYQQVLEKQPDNAEVLLLLGDSFRRAGDTAKAMAIYDALLAKDPKNIAAKEGKGLALIANGDFDTPAVLFDEVMQADAKRWKTLNALGILFTTRNLQPEAQQYFTEALKYHPESATITNNLGLSQALERRFDVSVATLARASTLATNGSQERKRIDLNTALVLASAGKQDEAKLIAQQYLTGSELDNNLGLYAHLAQDDKMAKAYLNKALSDSKVYYAKAWENLEDLNKQGASPAVAPPKPVAEAKVVKKPSTAKAAAPAVKKAAPVAALSSMSPSAGAPVTLVTAKDMPTPPTVAADGDLLANAPPAPPPPARPRRAKH